MRVALVSSFPAFPATAGNRSRIQQLASAVLNLGHELKFILLPGMHDGGDDRAHEAAFGKAGYIKVTGEQARPNWPGKWTSQKLRGFWNVAVDWVTRYPAGRSLVGQIVRQRYELMQRLGLQTWYSPLDHSRDTVWAEQIARAGRDVDAVIVEYVFNSWAFECFPKSAVRLLDTHDAFADRHHAYLSAGIRDYWLSLTKADENAGFRRADVILAIQEEEARRFGSQLASGGDGCSPGVAVVSHLLRQGQAPLASRTANSAVFLASGNAANRHAVGAFIQHVLPRVVREVPDFNLLLAGSISGCVPDSPNVTKLGWVDDVHAAFARSALSINPILVGTGINIKLLDALAAGVPTVSTTTGLRGLDKSFHNGVLEVPDHDHAAFATAIIRLLGDRELHRRMADAAFADARRWNEQQRAALERCLTAAARQRAVDPT